MQNTKQNKWNALSMKEKAELMGIFVKQGIYDLQQIKDTYNNFDSTASDTYAQSEYVDTYSNGGNLFFAGGENNTNGNNPPAYNLGLRLGTGFDAFGRSVYTEQDRQRDEKFRKAQETNNKQQGQKLIKESNRLKAQQTKEVMLNSGRFVKMPDETIKQSTGDKPLEQSNIDFDLLLALATAGTGSIAKNSIKGLAKGINKFNKTTLGKTLDLIGTVDGTINLATDEGITKTIRKAKEGDAFGAAISGLGDAFDLFGGIGLVGKTFNKTLGFNGINKRFAEASLRGGDYLKQAMTSINSNPSFSNIKRNLKKVYPKQTMQYILTGKGKPYLNYQGNWAGQENNYGIPYRDYIDMGLNPQKYANDFITTEEGVRRGIVTPDLQKWAKKHNVNKVFNAGSFDIPKLANETIRNAELGLGSSNKIIKANNLTLPLYKDLGVYSTALPFTNNYNSFDPGNFHMYILPNNKSKRGYTMTITDANKYFGKDLLNNNFIKSDKDIENLIKSPRKTKLKYKAMEKGFDFLIGNYHEPFLVGGISK